MIIPIVSYGTEEITVTRDLAQFLRGWVTGFITGVSLTLLVVYIVVRVG